VEDDEEEVSEEKWGSIAGVGGMVAAASFWRREVWKALVMRGELKLGRRKSWIGACKRIAWAAVR
jgi:hypothetical protein